MKTKVKLKDIASYSKGSQINGDKLIENGMYEYLNGGINPSGKWDDYNTPGGTVTISEGGNSCGYVNFMENPFWCGAHCYYLYDTVQNVRYLYYALKSQQDRLMKIRSGACMPNIKKADLGEFDLFFDTDKVEQQGAVDVLQRAERIIADRQYELHVLEDLKKARFVELFETKQDNYDECHLEDVADIVSGITKGRKTKCTQLREVPYMAVSNVKDGYIDWTTVKTILATEDEIEQYRLLPNDVLMTEGGDPDKVGRGSIISDPPEDCIHQNHIFRVRLDETRLLPRYFATFLQSPVAKMYFLRAAKQTTGIASINMKQLRGLPTILPPLNKQREFVLFCQQVDKSKFEVQRSLDEAQKLFDSLMQEYFS